MGWDGRLGATAHGVHTHSGRIEAAAAWESREGHVRAFCPYAGVGC
jgi:hypothetical protein